jgi:hypothetical protein
MASNTYSGLTSDLNVYTERAYSQPQVDTFISNAEAKFNRRLGPNYRRTTAATLTTDANGEAPLPSGFVAMRSLVRDLAGSIPLVQVSWDALIRLNPYEITNNAAFYSFRGSTLRVAPVTEDSYLAVYDASLTPLSGGNPNNWLSNEAPDIYLTMTLAEAKLFEEELNTAAAYEAKAYEMLDDLTNRDVVAQYSNIEIVMDMATP